MYDEGSPCAICGNTVGAEQVITFDSLGGDLGDLAAVSDGVAHTRCLDSWAERDELVERWNAALRAARIGRRLVVNADGHVGYE